MKRFVVVATGRSATKYMSRVLNECGLSCGHEDVFTVQAPGFHGWNGYLGDASWLAVPYLDSLPRDTVILHQVRNPSATIRSLASTGIFRPFSLRWHVVMPLWRLFRGKPLVDPYRRFVRRQSDRTWEEFSELARAARHWLEWNARIENAVATPARPYLRYRVEDLDREGLQQILALLDARSVDKLPDVSRKTNTRPPRYAKEELSLPDSLSDEVREVAHRYGYSAPDLHGAFGDDAE